MAQATYTVPTTALYRSDDGLTVQKFYEGAVVSMETAVFLNMPDAAMPAAGAFYSSEEQAAIRALGHQYTIPAGRGLDFNYAYPGLRGTVAMGANNLFLAPIHSPVDYAIVSFEFDVTTAGTAGAKARIVLYGPSASTPLDVALIDDLGEVDVAATGVKSIVQAYAYVAGSNEYWGIFASAAITVRAYTSYRSPFGVSGAGETLSRGGLIKTSGLTYGAAPASVTGLTPAGAAVGVTGIVGA